MEEEAEKRKDGKSICRAKKRSRRLASFFSFFLNGGPSSSSSNLFPLKDPHGTKAGRRRKKERTT